MSTTNTLSTKLAVAFVALAMVIGFAFTAPKVSAQTLDQDQIDSIVGLLQSFGADSSTVADVTAALTGQPTTDGTSGTSATTVADFTQNLTTGSESHEVLRLQQFLNDQGFAVASSGAGSPGSETNYFGSRTQSALAAFQAAHNISPAVGYFGPITRASVNSMLTDQLSDDEKSDDPSDDPVAEEDEEEEDLPAVEGRISASRLATPGNVDLNLGSSQAVYGFGVEAFDSQMSVRRVDVRLDVDEATGTGASDHITERQLADIVDSLSIRVAGETLGTTDVTRSNLMDTTDDNVYTLRVAGFNENVSAGSTRNFEVVASISDNENNHISGLENYGIKTRIASNGIRAIDQAGLNQFAGTSNERTFTIKDEATAGLEVQSNDATPEEGIVMVDEDSSTDDIDLLAFDLEVEDRDVELFDLTTDLDFKNAGGTSANELLEDHFSNVSLIYDGATIATEAAEGDATSGSVGITFEDIDTVLEPGVHEMWIQIDARDWDSSVEGYNLSASVQDSGLTVEDVASGDTNIVSGGTVEGEAQYFYTSVPQVSLTNRSLSVTGDDQEIATATLEFDVTAEGGDVYVANLAGADHTASTTGSGTLLGTNNALSGDATTSWNADLSTTSNATSVTTDGWRVKEGQTESFEAFVIIEGVAADGLGGLRVLLEDLRWATNETDVTGHTGVVGLPGDLLDGFQTPRESARVF